MKILRLIETVLMRLTLLIVIIAVNSKHVQQHFIYHFDR